MTVAHPKVASNLPVEREAYYAHARVELSKRYKSFDPVGMEMLFNLIWTTHGFTAHMAARLAEHGITLAGLNILGILMMRGRGGCPLNTLSGLLLVSRANITGLVDNLVRKGFVKREDHAEDRRIVLAKLTKEGQTWLDGYLPGHYQRIQEVLAGLTPAEKRTTTKLLIKLRTSSCVHPAACSASTE